MFIVIASLWSLSFAGFGYAIALKTGNPAAVNSSFLLFFPFLFLTSSYVPRDQLSGWLDTVAGWNPVTYLLEGMRSLALSGWHWDDLGRAALALLVVFLISFALCFAALRSRVRRSLTACRRRRRRSTGSAVPSRRPAPGRSIRDDHSRHRARDPRGGTIR